MTSTDNTDNIVTPEPEETDEGGTATRKIPIWSDLAPKNKKIASISIISAFMILFSMVAYNARQANLPAAKDEVIEKKEINMDNGMIEKSLQDVLLSQNKQKDIEIEAIKLRLEEMKNNPAGSGGMSTQTDYPVASNSFGASRNIDPAMLPEPPLSKNEVDGMTLPPPPRSRSNTAYKAGVDESYRNTGMSAPLPSPTPSETPQPTLIGEIDSTPVAGGEDDKKKSPLDGKNTIYLPPSFVEATLLSGVTAKTSAQGKEDPSPLLFRIKNLAILPNNIKANIKGCFVIAEGIGDLADERVHTRLTTLSCVAKNGESVIDQEVKGWVEDNADGKVGLSGVVVAKMGMHIARTALAGFVGGFGDALSQSTMTTAMTTSGIPSTAYVGDDTKDFAKAGAGQGIKGASDDLKKFYLKLAEQTIPVIEVLPAKTVTLVFSAGVNLEIKNVKMGGLNK